MATLGAPPGLAAWRVGLERAPEDACEPHNAGAGAFAELRDMALGVSAQHGGHGASDGFHIRDPRGGPRPPGDRIAVVAHASALLADAWSTALLVLGMLPDSAPRGLAGLLGEGLPGRRRWRDCGAATEAFRFDPEHERRALQECVHARAPSQDIHEHRKNT